jgi:hypothetical protein
MKSMKHMQHNNRAIQLNEFQLIAQERLTSVLEIYYEKHVHKKFLADVYAVIPKGRKCVVWFTCKQCWMFQIAKRPHQSNQETVSFDDVRMLTMPRMDDAWYSGEGTILYGTFMPNKIWFSVENVHYFCGAKQQNDGSMDRFIAFFDSLKKCKQLETTTTPSLHFFMPIMHTSFNAALKDAMQITSYDVFCIQHRFLKRPCTEDKNLLMHLVAEHTTQMNPMQPHAHTHTQTIQPPIQFQPTQARQAHAKPPSMHAMQSPPLRAFIIRPDVQNDIYYVLHNENDPITDKTMIAHIPNYKTSVMMNSIFRNIKENRNLDALEESDDEEEDDTSELVDLTKCVRMTCSFNHRFKRWQPCACA